MIATPPTEETPTVEQPEDAEHRRVQAELAECRARIASAEAIFCERRAQNVAALRTRTTMAQWQADKLALPDLEREEERLRRLRDEAASRRAQELAAARRPHMRGIRERLLTALATAAAIAGEGMQAARADRARGADSGDVPALRLAADAVTAAREYAHRVAGGAAS